MVRDNKMEILYRQIEEICRQFKVMRSEAGNIFSESNLADTTVQLNDVLLSTEDATLKILSAATRIGGMAGEHCPPAATAGINAEISQIYEACSFQDLSGQRIRAVLSNINDLGAKLQKLSDDVKSEALFKPARNRDPLLNGPALTKEAPSQEEIDAMMAQ